MREVDDLRQQVGELFVQYTVDDIFFCLIILIEGSSRNPSSAGNVADSNILKFIVLPQLNKSLLDGFNGQLMGAIIRRLKNLLSPFFPVQSCHNESPFIR